MGRLRQPRIGRPSPSVHARAQLLGIHLYTTGWVRNILVIIDFVCLIASLVIAIVTYPEQAGGHRIVSTIAILLSAGLTAAGGMLIFLMFINQ